MTEKFYQWKKIIKCINNTETDCDENNELLTFEIIKNSINIKISNKDKNKSFEELTNLFIKNININDCVLYIMDILVASNTILKSNNESIEHNDVVHIFTCGIIQHSDNFFVYDYNGSSESPTNKTLIEKQIKLDRMKTWINRTSLSILEYISNYHIELNKEIHDKYIINYELLINIDYSII